MKQKEKENFSKLMCKKFGDAVVKNVCDWQTSNIILEPFVLVN